MNCSCDGQGLTIWAALWRLEMVSRPASPELLTREPYLLPTGIRIHRVFEPISETNAWIATESGIVWPLRATYLICKG
jgi:hypothetical protein